MKRKRVILGLAVFLLVALSFAGGCYLGWRYGFGYAYCQHSSFNALLNVDDLKRLRGGEIEETIQRTEFLLDHHVYETDFWGTYAIGNSLQGQVDRVLSQVADYRETHPRKHMTPPSVLKLEFDLEADRILREAREKRKKGSP